MSNQYITINPDIMSGTAVFTGTRVTVKTLFDYIDSGKTSQDFLNDFDWVSKEQVHYVLNLAGKSFSSPKIFELADENPA